MNSVRFLAVELLYQAYQTEITSDDPLLRAKVLEEMVFRNSGNNYVKQIVTIGLHLSQRTYVGFYSLIFNYLARNLELSNEFLQNIPKWSLQDFFPELYDNGLLSDNQKMSLQQQHIREFNSLLNAFNHASKKDTVQFFRPCDQDFLEDTKSDDLYSRCYNQICVTQRFQSSQSLDQASEATYSSPMNTQLILDQPTQGTKFPQIYCLPTKALLISMVYNQINPLSGRKYSPCTIRTVEFNFHIELKLVKYALGL